MTQPEQLHTLEIAYPPYEAERSLTCMSVDNFENYEPVDFREFLPVEIARDELKIYAMDITRNILEVRKESFGNDAHPISNMQKIGLFLGRMAVKPFGKLSYIDNLTLFDNTIQSPGVTSTLHRHSFVVESNIGTSGEGNGHRSVSNLLTKDAYVESVAVHELIHLAGIPDVAYFIPDKHTRRSVLSIKFSPMMFQRGDHAGGLFEEGFATLGAYMYLWQKYPEVISDTRTELRVAPDGHGLDLPVRHALYDNSYAYAAWAMERLVDFSPQIWDIFQRSRVYGSSSEVVRQSLKMEVDELSGGLFRYLDAVDLKDLGESMRAASLVNKLVTEKIGERKL